MHEFEKHLTDLDKIGSRDLLLDLLSQMPAGLGQVVFVNALNQCCQPRKEDQRRLAKLDALERNGVDNWERYDDAMSELDDEDDEDDD